MSIYPEFDPTAAALVDLVRKNTGKGVGYGCPSVGTASRLAHAIRMVVKANRRAHVWIAHHAGKPPTAHVRLDPQ